MSQPPPYPPTPGSAGPPGFTPNPAEASSRRNKVVIGLVVAILAGLMLLVVFAFVSLLAVDDLRTPAADVKKPASLRDEPAGGTNRTETGEGPEYGKVSCVFSGTSSLTPGIASGQLEVPSKQKMALNPGSAFQCKDQYGESAGKVSMSAAFPALSASAGSGAGTGSIDWETVPPAALEEHAKETSGPAGGLLQSSTFNEVDLIFPQIIVWIEIVDGPYAGLRGKLVLNDWELIKSPDDTIIGLRFRPTDFKLGIT